MSLSPKREEGAEEQAAVAEAEVEAVEEEGG